MPKMTLIDMVQDILSDMNSDEVNSINDTVESLQVAQIIKSTYFNIIDGKDWPHLYQLYQLTPYADVAKPTHFYLPDNAIEVEWLKYNTKVLSTDKDALRDIQYKSPKEFMQILDARDSSASYVTVVEDNSAIDFNIYNDRVPSYYTSFDNETIILDAFINTLESTLQGSKTQVYGKMYPTWTMADSFIPDLPTQSFSYLLNEAKATCFLRIKEMADGKAEQHSVTQRRRQSQDSWRVADTVGYAAYGRRGKKGGKKTMSGKDGVAPGTSLGIFGDGS